jgi:uncharacterized membrane protein
MNLEKSDYAAIGLLVLMLGVTIHGYTQIEGDIAIHFDSSNQPDSTMEKLPGLLLLPLVSIAVLALFKLLPSIDPLKENVENFKPAFKWLAVAITAFMAYIQALIVIWNLGVFFDISKAVIPALAAGFYAVGLVMEKARRNWFIGLRTPWTLSSDEVWDRTHQKIAPWFKLAAFFSFGGLFFPDRVLEFVVLPVVLVSVAGVVYSYKIYGEVEE